MKFDELPLLFGDANLARVVTANASVICTLNGEIKVAPGFENVENFPKKSDNLTSCEVKKWKQFIFTAINPRIYIRQFEFVFVDWMFGCNYKVFIILYSNIP